MKLRLSEDTVRIRLRQGEVAQLSGSGEVSTSVTFGGGRTFTYRVVASDAVGAPRAVLGPATLAVELPAADVRNWADSDEVAIEGQQESLLVLVEKDFQCLHKPADAEKDAFPNPLAASPLL